MKKENQQRSAVPLAKSFRGKVDLLVLLAIVVSVVLILAATVPAAQSRLQGTVKNYMLDMLRLQALKTRVADTERLLTMEKTKFSMQKH